VTDWIGKRIGVVKGWGPRGIDIVAIGGMEPARAAMKTNQIDGYISSLESGFALEEAKEWRVITTATPFVDPKAVAVLKESFIEMGLLKEIPDDNVMFTTRFVPVKAGM